ncbi:DNA-directed RNA polymerases II and V subunit 8A-like [Cornus florida]|uniref:DNA-directed RNA polymerases II and V subunit 8A-like n=1 Tax=Cornus florida TaxID=4283 RepID=UPI002897023B|nr:DNA-directed RNA polymerases II and V subunit 8A-like [Cornus florida]
MVELYFDDVIKVDRVNADGKKFDKVSRIEAQSEEDDMLVLLDVQSEIYPINAGEKFRMVLAPTLNLDGTAVSSYSSEGGPKSLADKFEYVMHGLLYKMSEDTSSTIVKVMIYISFGGLQMMLKGDPNKMEKFKVDQRLFLLLRKV